MKKTMFFNGIFILLLVLTVSSVYSQPDKIYDFPEGGVTFTIPETWEVSREHVLLLLMPKAEDLIVETSLEENEFDVVIEETINKIKLDFPLDTNIIRKDIRIEKFDIVELVLQTDKIKVNYFLIKTPQEKVLKMHYQSDISIANKYKNEINFIKENIREIKK